MLRRLACRVAASRRCSAGNSAALAAYRRPPAALGASPNAMNSPQAWSTLRCCGTVGVPTDGGGGASSTGAPEKHSPSAHHRRSFQPFSARDEEDLVKVISTRPRHVLRHVRQLVWRSRKRELHFRNMATQLMVVIQDFLRKQLIDPQHASVIMEGILEECVKLSQHDMAHLLFRAFLRFRKYGCTISVDAVRHLFESYKGTDNAELMVQLAQELKGDAESRALCVAALLFAGRVEEADKLMADVDIRDVTGQDIIALLDGYDKLQDTRRLRELIDLIPRFERPASELTDVYAAALRVFWRRDDETLFNVVLEQARSNKDVLFSGDGHATVLRMRLRHAQSIEDISKIENDLRQHGYVPDLTGNSVIVAAYARVTHFGDKLSEDVMLGKVDTLLSSVEMRLKQGDPEMDVSAAHIRAVIRGYGAAGRPELMKKAWEKMQHKGLSNDTRVFNELLKWFALMGNVKDVLQTKYEMATQGVIADAQTYTWVFRALGRWYPRQIEKFYQEMCDARVRPDVALYTTLVGVLGDLEMYDRCEALHQEVDKREQSGSLAISPSFYAVLLRVFMHDLTKVEAIYKEAATKAVADHDYIMTSLVHAFASHADGDKRLEDILSTLPRWSINVYNVLINMYGKKNMPEKVQQLLEKMKADRVEFNDVTYGTLVTVFGRWKDVEKVQSILEELKQREGGISANFYSILAATYARMGDTKGIDNAWEDLISSRLFPDTETYNHFLALYARANNATKMQTVMDSMLKQVPPNPLTATTVVDMLGKAGRIAEMETLVSDMRRMPETAPTTVTFHQMMNAYAKTGDIANMERIREELLASGFEENAVTFNILADGYGRARRFEQLMDVLKRREAKNVAMEELGYCVLITAFGRVRHVAEVTRLANELKPLRGDKALVSKKVVWSLIDAFCRCNDAAAMDEWTKELEPLTAGDRNTLLPYLCRLTMLERVEEHITLLESSSHDVTFSALNAMSKAYARSGRFDKCVETLHRMRDRGFVPDAATALSLSNLFMRAGLHEQAQQVVQWRRQHASALSDEAEDNIV